MCYYILSEVVPSLHILLNRSSPCRATHPVFLRCRRKAQSCLFDIHSRKEGVQTVAVMDDRHNEVISVATLFFVLTWLAVSLRCYVRGIIMKTWGMDDYYMVAALVGAAINTTLCFVTERAS
jgi:hypothetical protein